MKGGRLRQRNPKTWFLVNEKTGQYVELFCEETPTLLLGKALMNNSLFWHSSSWEIAARKPSGYTKIKWQKAGFWSLGWNSVTSRANKEKALGKL